MAPEIESRDVQEMAVEYVVFDRAEQPKRRRILPLAHLLVPLKAVTAERGA